MEISEYARINTEMSLPKAKDPDEGKFGIQRYRIASGNVNNAFRLSFDGDAFLDLVVNGQLDREYRAKYELVVEAVDGGRPPKWVEIKANLLDIFGSRVGAIRVQVDVLDANDNAPGKIKKIIFNFKIVFRIRAAALFRANWAKCGAGHSYFEGGGQGPGRGRKWPN